MCTKVTQNNYYCFQQKNVIAPLDLKAYSYQITVIFSEQLSRYIKENWKEFEAAMITRNHVSNPLFWIMFMFFVNPTRGFHWNSSWSNRILDDFHCDCHYYLQ